MDVGEEEAAYMMDSRSHQQHWQKAIDDLKEIALNRNVWKKFVHDVSRGRPQTDGH